MYPATARPTGWRSTRTVESAVVRSHAATGSASASSIVVPPRRSASCPLRTRTRSRYAVSSDAGSAACGLDVDRRRRRRRQRLPRRAGGEPRGRRVGGPAHRRPDPLVGLACRSSRSPRRSRGTASRARSAAGTRRASPRPGRPRSSVMIRVWSWFVRNVAGLVRGPRRGRVAERRPRAAPASPVLDREAIGARPSPKSNVRSSALRDIARRRSIAGSQTSPRSIASGPAAWAAALNPASHAFVSGVFVCASGPSSMRCFAASSRKPSTPTSASQNRATSSSSAVTAGLRRLRSGMPSQNSRSRSRSPSRVPRRPARPARATTGLSSDHRYQSRMSSSPAADVLEPRVLDRGVVEHEVDDDLDAPLVRRGDERVEVLGGAVVAARPPRSRSRRSRDSSAPRRSASATARRRPGRRSWPGRRR